jgi:dCMP deaminase
MVNKDKKALVAFVPVIHKGYVDLFLKYKNSDLFILNKDLINNYTSLTRDLRVVDPEVLIKALEGLGFMHSVNVLSDMAVLNDYQSVIMPDEDVMHDLVDKNPQLKDKTVFEKVFLRYDKIITQTETDPVPGRKVSLDSVDKEIIETAFMEADKSYDFWRQIGAVIVKDGEIVLKSHNRHLPNDFSYMTFGDPRSNFNAGERLDIYTSIHGESDLVAKAANQGISLKGCSIYVSTFPCSNCARLIGEAGIKKVFYAKGYSRLDAERVLNHYGVEIIQVE